MPLHELGSVPAALVWLARRGARALTTDSRRVADADSSAFIAWPGYANDARQFVGAALRDGAVACVLEAEHVQAFGFARSERLAVMRDLKAHTGPLASGFFGAPSDRLKVVAATGTNGKTSTAWWTAQALTALGMRCGVVGTLGIGEPPAIRPTGGEAAAAEQPAALQFTGLTTPDPVTLHAAFRRFVDDGFAACALEASSHGLEEHRLSGTHIDVALLTNVTQDHLDYHGTMEAYWQAKARLFSWPGLRAAVLNADDAHGAALAAKLPSSSLDVWTYSVPQAGSPPVAMNARLQAHDVSYRDGGLCFTLREGVFSADVRSRLIGDYNVSNLLAVIGGLRALGISLDDAAAVCAGLTPVPGRMQRVGVDGLTVDAGSARPEAGAAVAAPEVVVDYAHTPDALEKALRALQPLAAARGGALWCVFGCGGNRDGSKRPLMGALAQRLAQHVVVTSDNPRLEAPAAIIAGIVGGMAAHPASMARVTVIEDRRAAIAHAVSQAHAKDVVLIAGKGHEDYQDAAGVKLPFDDVAEARTALSSPSSLWGEGVARAHRHRGQGVMMTLGQAHALLPSSTLVGDAATRIARVHSDTRSLRAGDLFVALRGERFDAHDFMPQAAEAGAVAALAERGLAEAALPGLQVADTRAALGQLAAAWRAQFKLPLIAVTGSNGKTTVTQMVAAILNAWLGDAALATQGNFNNDIGLPLTLLRLRAEHRAAVVELGMNHPGEIAQLAALAAPGVALVNNAQREHQEFMASVEAVALENGAVISALTEDGCAVFPAADAFSGLWRQLAGTRRTLTFGLRSDLADVDTDSTPDVAADAAWHTDHWQLELHTPQGVAALSLHVAGAHNVRNAAAAAACALAAGCPLDAVARGLEAFAPVAGRSQAKPLQRGGHALTLIDDSYNANPDSVRAAIDVLATLPAPRWLVLGDMGEVGDQGVAFHAEVGAYAKARGVDALWTVGTLCTHASAAFAGARHFEAVADLLCALSAAPPFESVLVKGSRFMRMEQVVAALGAPAAEAPHAA